MKKRVLQANLDGTGGAFSLMYQLQKQLSSEYIFDYYWMGKFVSSSRSKELEELGSKIYEDDLRKNKIIGHLLLPWHFYHFLKDKDYDIVHVNADLAYKELLYLIPAKMAGVKKIIIHSHSSGVNGDHKKIKTFLHNICKPFLKEKNVVYLTCSKVAAKWMFGKNNSAVMLNNGVDLKKFQYDCATRQHIRKKLNVRGIVLGAVGNLSYQKNPYFLIDLMRNLDSPENYTLLFVGDGDSRRDVEAYAQKRGVYDKCIFYGNSSDVVELLDAMDIYLMPSRFEGLPVSAVEAQANGLSCILSNRITDEVKLLPSCKMLDIESGVVEWAKEIKNTSVNEDRKASIKVLKEKGFDIIDTAKKLKAIYDMG